MMDVLGRIARFVQEFDFSRFAPESINADLKVEDGHLAYGIGDDERAFIWVLREEHRQAGEEPTVVTLEGVERGVVEVAFWDPWSAEWLSREVMDSPGYLRIVTPAFTKDITIVLRYLGR